MKRSVLLLSVFLPACTGWGDYAGPAPLGSAAPPPAFVRGQTTMVAPQAPTLAPWWQALGDPVLDAIETRAIAGSPTMAVARARVERARADTRLERANGLPSSNATALYLRGDLPPTNLGIGTGDDGGTGNGSDGGRSTIDLFNVGFDASWEVDLFGGQRRRVEAARAAAEGLDANLADAQVSLTADVAQTYVEYRDRQHRIAIAIRSAAVQRDMVTLLRQRIAAGTAMRSELEQALQQQTAANAQAIPLEAERDVLLNALAVLVGTAPGGLDALLGETRNVPMPPAQVAVGDPAGLLQRRPDVRAAERELAGRTAGIGVAQAARFPRVSFMGLLGLGGSDAGDVLDPGNLSLLALPRLQWSFLDFGRNRARVRQAEATRDEAEARYRGTVLTALRDAEDALTRFGGRRAMLARALETEQSTQRALALARTRSAAGTIRRGDRLDAERHWLTAQDASAQAGTAVTVAFIGVQKALGLGWQPGGGGDGPGVRRNP